MCIFGVFGFIILLLLPFYISYNVCLAHSNHYPHVCHFFYSKYIFLFDPEDLQKTFSCCDSSSLRGSVSIVKKAYLKCLFNTLPAVYY